MLAILLIALCLASEEVLSQNDVISTGIDFGPEEGLPSYWKIIGGQQAKYGEFPSMLSLEYEGDQMCGASAIGDHWALTAAHCATGIDVEKVVLRAGSLTVKEGGTLHKAKRLVVHHHYGLEDSLDNDIALIQVYEPLTSNKYVKLVPLPSHKDLPLPPGTHLTVSGWGATRSIFEPPTNSPLKKADVVVLSKKTCQDDPTLSGSMVITDNMICAQEKGQTAYKGDSGGPLFLRTKEGVVQVGVVSWGDFTGQQKHPTVFTKVSNYRLWIRMKSGI